MEKSVDLKDKTINCKECKKDFVFTVGEQEFYNSKGFQNEPQRCPECRAQRSKSNNFNRNNNNSFRGN